MFTQTALWVASGAFLAMSYLLFASFGAGWFAARRSALAGGLSVLLGAEAAAVFQFITATPLELAGASTLDLLGWAARLAVWALPYALGGAFAGAAGGWLRSRALRRA
ncbi:MAG TPA: hypothetical protein VFQ66_02990 [Candidatus Limnocylindria bacterium]|nr:hypothetical protein [Candidatus Limnocylindria bacterium]